MGSPQLGKKSMFQKALIAPKPDSPKRQCFENQRLLPTNATPIATVASVVSGSTAETSCQQSTEAQPLSLEPVNNSTLRHWVRIRTAVSATNAITKSVAGHASKKLEREDSFIKKFSTQAVSAVLQVEGGGSVSEQVSIGRKRDLLRWSRICELTTVRKLTRVIIQPKSGFIFFWLGCVTGAVLYNLWTSIAREAFPELVNDCFPIWISFDAFFDFIYLLDVLVQMKTGCFEKGIMVRDPKKVAIAYLHSRSFILDALSLFPLDLIQFWLGVHPLMRFPRFLKVYRCLEWNQMVENWTPFPNFWRVLNLSHVVFLGCHWFAAFYYLISQAEGFHSKWGYPEPKNEYASVSRKYLKSLYWSTLTLTTIGDLLPPESNWQHIFTIGTYLIGVFVFASIVGQVGNVINNRNQSRQEFETMLDNAKSYMRTHSVPTILQRRVQRWYEYAWNRGKLNGAGDLCFALGMLPHRLKTEIALHVNLETLRKVTIFQSCRPEFLHDLVLKMKTLICCEGDFVCRKGEVAREMFIIADGILEVISEAGEVVSRMSAGDFFGEIGILNMEGGVNRRTADVRSVGYSELFVLSRDDVLDALKDHPDADSIIREYGVRRLREMAARKAKTGTSSVGVSTPVQSECVSKALVDAQSFSSAAEITRTASVVTLSVTNEIEPSAPNADEASKRDLGPRARRPFQVAQSSRMPFIDEDSGDHAREAEVPSDLQSASTRNSSGIAFALRQVAAMSAMPILTKEHRSRCRVRKRRSSTNEAKQQPPEEVPQHLAAIKNAFDDSMAFLTDARITELQFENARKQQQIECLQQRISALQRLVVKNCEVFDILLGTGAMTPSNGTMQKDGDPINFDSLEQAACKSNSQPAGALANN